MSGPQELRLQLEALRLSAAGNLEQAAQILTEAADFETLSGWKQAAQHTRHKLALLRNFKGDLALVKRYYDETLKTVKGLKNWQGVGLCLRSLGEFALYEGRTMDAINAWQFGKKAFEYAGLADAAQLARWIQSMELSEEIVKE